MTNGVSADRVVSAGRVPGRDRINTGREFEVRYSDIDVNAHVNNARYLGWLLDSYPPEHHRKAELASCEVNYLGEAGCGDRVLLRTTHLDDQQDLQSVQLSGGPEICRARLAWGADRF